MELLRLSVVSRKSTILVLLFIVMLSPSECSSVVKCVLKEAASLGVVSLRRRRPSSRYSPPPMCGKLRCMWCKMYKPTRSLTSAESYAPILTSKGLLVVDPFFIQMLPLWASRVLRECMMMSLCSSEMRANWLA